MQKVDGWKSYHTFFGYIGLPLIGQQGETPFSMTYGAEVVIPFETGFLTLRISLFTPDNNDNLLEKGLDLIKEWRENVMVQLAYY